MIRFPNGERDKKYPQHAVHDARQKEITEFPYPLFPVTVPVDEEEKPTNHGKGKFCTKCGARKDTKKIGNKFLCKDCRGN